MIIKISLAALLLLVSSGSVFAQDIALYNFSVLLPLAQKDSTELAGLGDLGCSLSFFTKSLFEKIPPLLPATLTEDGNYSAMRLVGFRMDPIDEEFRLVFQPLREATNPRNGAAIEAEDAALHLLFKSTQAHVMREVNGLQRRYPNIPKNLLGVHPAFDDAAQATRSLKSLLCRIASLELYKATFMTVRNGRVLWHFGGFLVSDKNGRRVLGDAIDIPNMDRLFKDPNREVDTSVQRIVRGPRRLGANVIPLPVRGDHMNEVYELAETVFDSDNVNRIRLQVDRIENPTLNSPKTVDCLSCHATESVRQLGAIQHDVTPSPSAYPVPSSYGLDKSVPILRLMDTINFRAFGYYDFDPVVINRVLLESIHFQKNFKASL